MEKWLNIYFDKRFCQQAMELMYLCRITLTVYKRNLCRANVAELRVYGYFLSLTLSFRGWQRSYLRAIQKCFSSEFFANSKPLQSFIPNCLLHVSGEEQGYCFHFCEALWSRTDLSAMHSCDVKSSCNVWCATGHVIDTKTNVYHIE